MVFFAPYAHTSNHFKADGILHAFGARSKLYFTTDGTVRAFGARSKHYFKTIGFLRLRCSLKTRVRLRRSLQTFLRPMEFFKTDGILRAFGAR